MSDDSITTLRLLSHLRRSGALLSVENGRLCVRAGGSALPDELQVRIRRHEDQLVSLLAAAGRARSFPRLPRGEAAPLSFGQERLWLLHQLDPGSDAYNIPIALRLIGDLDTEALRRSLEEIIRRHEALRTTFETADSVPVQRIQPPAPADLALVDISDVPPASRERTAMTIIMEKARAGFCLSRQQAIRVSLLRLDLRDHILVVVFHHIAFDGWSLALFLRELAESYNAFLEGSLPRLPEPAIQYQDHARWERHSAQAAQQETQLRWWQDRLAGLPPLLDLLLDHPRPPVQSTRGAQIAFTIPAAVTRDLAALCRTHDVTLFMVLLAGLNILLFRWTGEADVAVGTVVANRRWAESEAAIGFFLNSVVLRNQLSDRLTVADLLRGVRGSTLDAFAHQDVPFARIIDAIRPGRSLSHSPLFQVMLVLQNTPPISLGLRGLDVRSVSLPAESTKFDLNIHVQESGDCLRGLVSYATDIFERDTVERMFTAFTEVLGAAAADPNARLADLPAWGGKGPHDIAARRGLRPATPFVEFPRREICQTIHARFEEQAALRPDSPAVLADRASWTYRELDRKANRVALAISAGAPRTTAPVAVLFGQGAAMTAGILGVLKAGSAYVPLDPAAPVKRLAAMLQQTGCRAVVTDGRSAGLAAALRSEKVPLVVIDERDPGRDAPPVAQTDTARRDPDAAAYVLHTSGSTGQPKGVVQSHRNVLHFISVYTNNLHIGPPDRLSQLSTCSFDAAVMDMFGALLNSASLYPFDLRENGFARAASWLADNRISIFHATPTVYRGILQALASESVRLEGVRLVVLGGEPALRSDLELYRRHFSDSCLFVNGLGPTESTVSLQFFADKSTRVMGAQVPAGWPVEETEVDLLDESGVPGLAGELVIRSPYVALGYLGEPELTRSAFPPGPGGGRRRTYRTGDIGRVLPDGSIVFVGRRDEQVKIRGYRVEPGECQAVLLSIPGVRDAAVVPLRRASGQVSLAAYVVAAREGPSPLTENDLRAQLREHLPEYMIPSAFVFVDSLPLLSNGKLDRAALPPPDEPPAAKEYIAPRTELEWRVAERWASVLGREKVGARDDFFALGGDSLAATGIVAGLKSAFGIDLPLRAFFAEPTVEGCARALHAAEHKGRQDGLVAAGSAGQSLVVVQGNGRRAPFFFVAGAYGTEDDFLRYLSLMIPHLGSDQPVYGFRPRGLDGNAAPHRDIVEMAGDYVKDLLRVQPTGPYLLGGECVGGVVAYEMARQLRNRGFEVDLLVLLDTLVPNPVNALRFQLSYALKRWSRIFPHVGKALRAGVPRGLRYLRQVAARRARARVPRNEAQRQARARDALERVYTRTAYRYRPRQYGGTLTLIVNETDHALSPDLGWGAFAAGGVDARVVPGDHVTRLTKHGKRVADEVRACLDEARRRE